MPNALLQCQGQRLGSRSKVRVKVTSQGQSSKLNFWCAVVNIRGLALPSAARSTRSDYQSKLFVCVSVINVGMQIIARMWLISFRLHHIYIFR